MDVAVWLRSLGLGKYEAVFRENEIDETVLPILTAEDLKELGVTTLWHRRKLLDAIAVLPSDTSAVAFPAEVRRVSAASRAERRQVTVMFSELVGSTTLSARMDPEDFGEIVSAYHKSIAETVHRFGGFVANYMGDGVLVYFGYPQAHEIILISKFCAVASARDTRHNSLAFCRRAIARSRLSSLGIVRLGRRTISLKL